MHKGIDTTDVAWKQGSPAGTILRLLQRHGPLSIKQLQDELGVSTNAVREQLAQLQAAELIHQQTPETVGHRGAGRPAYRYALSARAHQLFPQGYDVLLNLLFEEIIAQDGSARLGALLDGVGTRLLQRTASVDATDQGVVHDLQAVLAQHQIPLTVVEDASSVNLQTWSCPYFDVASEHPAVCSMEVHMLERVLHQPVQLVERIVDGAAGCRFVVGERNVRSE